MFLKSKRLECGQKPQLFSVALMRASIYFSSLEELSKLAAMGINEKRTAVSMPVNGQH